MKHRTRAQRISFFRHFAIGLGASILLVLLNFCISMSTVYDYSHPKLLHQADAALVLGAAAWDKRPSPVFRERINHALFLYHTGMVKKLIFTGGSSKSGFMTEAAVGRRYAMKKGVPADDIVYENQSRDTYQNLINGKEIAENNNIDSVIIVSDPYHMARAALMAKDIGLDAQTSPTPTTRYTATSTKMHFLIQESYSLMIYQWMRGLHHVTKKFHLG